MGEHAVAPPTREFLDDTQVHQPVDTFRCGRKRETRPLAEIIERRDRPLAQRIEDAQGA